MELGPRDRLSQAFARLRNGSRTGDSHDKLGLRTEVTSAQYGMLRWSGALAM